VTRVATALAVALVTCGPVLARAAWLPNGNPAARPTSFQVGPSVATDGQGGAFTTWDGELWIPLQHLANNGDYAPGWDPTGRTYFPERPGYGFLLAITGRVLADGSGGFYLTWLDGGRCEAECGGEPRVLYVQRFTHVGLVAAGWPAQGVLIEHTGYWPAPVSTTVIGDDGILIAWYGTSDYPSPHGRLQVQSIGADGTVRWGTDGVFLTQLSEFTWAPAVVPDGGGGAFVFWEDKPGPAPVLLEQHVTAQGVPQWPTPGIEVAQAKYVRIAQPVAVTDGSRGTIVAWPAARDSDLDIYAARVTHGGQLPWHGDLPVCTARGPQAGVQLLAMSDGGAIAAWPDSRRPVGQAIYAQRVSHGGRLLWPFNGVPVCTAPGSRYPVVLASDGNDGAYLAWVDPRPEAELFATHLSGSGQPDARWPLDGAPLCEHPPVVNGELSHVDALDITATGQDSAIVAWADYRAANPFVNDDFSFATLLTPGGPAASTPRTALRPLANEPLSQEHAGRSDLPVEARWDNHAGVVVLRLSLPQALPANVDLFDVMGRAVSSTRLDAPRGTREVIVRLARRLSPGLYLVRLTQGRRCAMERFVVP
jgi:hypothetical protein